MKRRPEPWTVVLVAVVMAVGCRPDPMPKPRGYFRIDLPEQTYLPWSGDAPFKADLPTYTKLTPARQQGQAHWYDLRFPDQHATVHLTWSPVNGELERLIEDAHTFKDKHGAKAARIRSERVLRDEARVFGTLFDVDGDVASPMVFYLTDSTDHFLYGALYFNSRPNADSLAPVTARIREDIRHLTGTLHWRSP